MLGVALITGTILNERDDSNASSVHGIYIIWSMRSAAVCCCSSRPPGTSPKACYIFQVAPFLALCQRRPEARVNFKVRKLNK